LILLSIIAIVFLLVFFTVLYVIFKKKIQYWIVSDMKRGLINFVRPKPKNNIHIMFAFVDHFEPGSQGAGLEKQISSVEAWVRQYPELANRHKDRHGNPPQHTFFFPPNRDVHRHLKRIVWLCSRGFGEVEMHLHHARQEPWPDDAASLRKKIHNCLDRYAEYGVFCLPDGQRAYGFIHGDWALANSRKGGKHCGVNDEISILVDTGCYADFTFPVCNESQPKMANTIFYGQSSPSFPKGYNKLCSPVEEGNANRNGLMFIQGVIGLRWKSKTHKILPSIEQSNISPSDVPLKKRIDYWVRKAIHVKGKPNWIFIKVHGHGASEENREILQGNLYDDMFSYLETKYNDGEKYSLHYVSAREMFNIVRAAEGGKSGDPDEYRDYKIPRYVYLPERPR